MVGWALPGSFIATLCRAGGASLAGLHRTDFTDCFKGMDSQKDLEPMSSLAPPAGRATCKQPDESVVIPGNLFFMDSIAPRGISGRVQESR